MPALRLLIDRNSNTKFLAKENEDYHTKWGVIRKEEFSKRNPSSNKGRTFITIPPSFSDLYRKIRRKAQLAPLEMLGRIAIETGINHSSIVVDAGTGSGGACLYFAHLSKKVYSFDNNEEHLALGNDNAVFLGLKNLTITKADVYVEGFKKVKAQSVDLVFIDLPEPQNVIAHAYHVLKEGGFFVTYSPQITQVSLFKEKLDQFNAEDARFIDAKTIEVIERLWKVEKDIARPSFSSLGHNGFVTFMRKV